jgi:hypothetical protein
MPGQPATVDELVQAIKRSSLATILVEGGDDLEIYRWIESKIGIFRANVLPCGGRDKLLRVYERRAEFAGTKVAFVADRDLWIFTSVPSQYAEVIWTLGYSIENDMYCHSNIERLLEETEARSHGILLDCICRWFAYEVEEYICGREAEIHTHINVVVPPGSSDISSQFAQQRGFREPDPARAMWIRSEYQQVLRGKQLLQMLLRYLSSTHRQSKFSRSNLLELCLKTPGHPNVARILDEITGRLG